MGKFDGILLCSDMDGTLLDSESRISDKNKEAIRYFEENGGRFTFTTGRTPQGLKEMAKELSVNFPAVVFNGSGIYDFEKNRSLYDVYLDDGIDDVADYIAAQVPDCGIIVTCDDVQYCSRDNLIMNTYYKITRYERLEYMPHREINKRKKKVIFLTQSENVEKMRSAVVNSEFADRYNYMQTNWFLFEILPKGVNKGTALKKLAEMYSGFNKVIACGDGENDIAMLQFADVGVAAGNAMDCVKEAADYVSVSNDEGVVFDVIEKLERGII
ncbi:MAG: Cof-type HAD-IIB family hydrolase [Clostridiales bacterium]|nr:Cof-type HAD-IIB family hydrolase [Clostridiales bacterium]